MPQTPVEGFDKDTFVGVSVLKAYSMSSYSSVDDQLVNYHLLQEDFLMKVLMYTDQHSLCNICQGCGSWEREHM